jgi:DNA-binding NarL/FixJ family response regulator
MEKESVARPTVMIVDRRPIFQDGIERLLDEAGFDVIAKVGSPDDAVRRAAGLRPQIVVMGPYMGSGEDRDDVKDLVFDLLGKSPDSKILLSVTQADRERESLLTSLEHGATGLIDLDAPTSTFIQAARDLAGGRSYMPSHIAMSLISPPHKPSVDSLTVREREILVEIALGFTNTEIAEHTNLSVRTVESHRARINSKLGTTARSELVRIALDNGLIRRTLMGD